MQSLGPVLLRAPLRYGPARRVAKPCTSLTRTNSYITATTSVFSLLSLIRSHKNVLAVGSETLSGINTAHHRTPTYHSSSRMLGHSGLCIESIHLNPNNPPQSHAIVFLHCPNTHYPILTPSHSFKKSINTISLLAISKKSGGRSLCSCRMYM